MKKLSFIAALLCTIQLFAPASNSPRSAKEHAAKEGEVPALVIPGLKRMSGVSTLSEAEGAPQTLEDVRKMFSLDDIILSLKTFKKAGYGNAQEYRDTVIDAFNSANWRVLSASKRKALRELADISAWIANDTPQTPENIVAILEIYAANPVMDNPNNLGDFVLDVSVKLRNKFPELFGADSKKTPLGKRLWELVAKTW